MYLSWRWRNVFYKIEFRLTFSISHLYFPLCSIIYLPDMFNITNMRGKVAKFCIFKTVYRLGEDIIGTFNFSEGDIPCLQVRFLLLLLHTCCSRSRCLSNRFVVVTPSRVLVSSIQWASRARRRSSSSTSGVPARPSAWLGTGGTWSPASTRRPATSLCPFPSTSHQGSAQTQVGYWNTGTCEWNAIKWGWSPGLF